MDTMDFKRGASVLTAALGLLLAAGCGGSDDGENTSQTADAIKCLGANECAGMSECAGGPGGGECKGLNECAGMGWVYTDTEGECSELGGMPQT